MSGDVIKDVNFTPTETDALQRLAEGVQRLNTKAESHHKVLRSHSRQLKKLDILPSHLADISQNTRAMAETLAAMQTDNHTLFKSYGATSRDASSVKKMPTLVGVGLIVLLIAVIVFQGLQVSPPSKWKVGPGGLEVERYGHIEK